MAGVCVVCSMWPRHVLLKQIFGFFSSFEESGCGESERARDVWQSIRSFMKLAEEVQGPFGKSHKISYGIGSTSPPESARKDLDPVRGPSSGLVKHQIRCHPKLLFFRPLLLREHVNRFGTLRMQGIYRSRWMAKVHRYDPPRRRKECWQSGFSP